MPAQHESDPAKPEKWKFRTDGDLTGLFRDLLTKYDGFELADANRYQWRIRGEAIPAKKFSNQETLKLEPI